MKILILGAGQVGGTLATHLASETLDITLVDLDEVRLRELRSRLDIRTVVGWASHPHVLREAGAEDADMLIAVTGSDEVNMVACQVSYSMFRTPRKIARVRSAAYVNEKSLFADEHMPVDVFINPEQVVTDHVRLLLENPGALEVLDFAEGRVQLVAVRAYAGSPLVGQGLRDVRRRLPNVNTRVAAIFRGKQSIPPDGNTIIEAGDEVFLIVAAGQINSVMAELRDVERAFKRVTIAGGGNVGARLATSVERYFNVKLIEFDPDRADRLATTLKDAVVIQGDATNPDQLRDATRNSDVFCALTNDDEVNIMSSLMAKRYGVRRVMTLMRKPAYAELMRTSEIDVAISPQQSTTSSLLTHVRRGDVTRVHSLRRGAAEAMEAVARGDAKTSRIVGQPVKAIKLPKGVTIGAIVRRDAVIVEYENVVIETDDHLILFLTDKKRIADVERLFQVGFTFF
ncbi:MAG: Trk system potassium transporter TrkA [Gammaproteobacteria bacterium]|nr:Trk system potassium transporter TrkA [Gammaproteobacteria bacterium]